MNGASRARFLSVVVFVSTVAGCGGGGPTDPHTDPKLGPPAGNADGTCNVPAEAGAVDTSTPTHVVGTGTPDSCTSDAFVAAVAAGGIITFDCGPDPFVLTLTETAKVVNDAADDVVIDGGDTVTLSGAGARRILYMNTCDQAQHYTTSHCDDQATPRLTVQNLTFVDGNAKGDDPYGGGAIFVRGGRFKVLHSRFFHNVCDDVGPDVGGGAIRALDQYQDLPVYVVDSAFGGTTDSLGNVCSNGGALSSIGVSYTVLNSSFQGNAAIGHGANPAKPGTPGGGSGGAIYNDGNTYALAICGTSIENNTANEGGGAIFFVSNDDTGTLQIWNSVLRNNTSGTFETSGYPGIFWQTGTTPVTTGSTIE